MTLSGNHRILSLADLIQVAAVNRRTFRARLTGRDARGELYLNEGRVAHATYAHLVGDDAVFALLAEPELRYEVDVDVPPPVTTVARGWQSLLLEGAQRIDEGTAPPIGPPSAPAAAELTAPPRARRAGLRLRAMAAGALAAALALAVTWPFLPVRPLVPAPPAVGAPRASRVPAPETRSLAPVDAATLTGPGDRAPVIVRALPPRPPRVDLALAPTIVLRLLVDERGQVAEARVYRSRLELAAFEDAAVEAAQGFAFTPAERAGRPVAAWVNWPVGFAGAAGAPAVTARLVVKGSDTIGGALGPELARAFAAGHPGVEVTWEALGSGTAFVGLLDGSADLGASSRPVSENELAEAAHLGASLDEWVLGYDGIAIIVHPDNPLATLTVDEASRVFRGELGNWSQLGGPDRPIRLLSRPSYSGTHGFFRDHVLRKGDARGPEEFAAGTEWIEESAAIVARVAADPDAISYVGLGWVGPGVKAVKVSAGTGRPAVAPAVATVRDGSYPIYRPLLLYTRGAPKGALAALVRFVLSDAGQALVERHGFIRSDTPVDALVPPGAEAEAYERAAGAPAVRVAFRAGSTALEREAAAPLAALAQAARADGRGLLVVGHADAEGPRVSNQQMSRWRARVVAAHLEKLGVPAERLLVEGAGSDQPRSSNGTRTGRDQNRRVEVFVLPAGAMGAARAAGAAETAGAGGATSGATAGRARP